MTNSAFANGEANGEREAGFSQLYPQLQQWLACTRLSAAEIDCIVAVMLKILDGKCKMAEDEKIIMALLYDCAKGLKGLLLGDAYHQLIARARVSLDDVLIAEVYETRVLAETQISRPVMKKFKARLRAEGVLPVKTHEVRVDD